MTARLRRSFTPEFKAQTVELVRTSGKSVGEVCQDLDLTETAVRRWVAQAHVDAGRRDGLTTAEREEGMGFSRLPGQSGLDDIRGGWASRTPSPRRFTAKTVSIIARPGKTASHHATRTYLRPSASIKPHSAVGG